jgi:hypothetical protein
LDVALASVDALIEQTPSRMMIGHYGMVADGLALLKRHREQLLFWNNWLTRIIGGHSEGELLDVCAQGLLAQDAYLAGFSAFSESAQKRERYFLKNSINGFLGWIRNSESRPPP